MPQTPEHTPDQSQQQIPQENIEFQPAPSPVQIRQESQRRLDDRLQQDYSGFGGLQDAPDEEEVPEAEPVEEQERPEGFSFGRLLGAMGRGGLRSINENFQGAHEVGAAILEKTGLDNVAFYGDERAHQKFLDWYESDPETRDDPKIFNIDDERDEGVYGVVEGLTQGIAGFVGWSKYLKGAKLARVIPGIKGKKMWDLGRQTLAGALEAGLGWDPYEERLADIAQNGPAWVAQPLWEVLAAEGDDSQAVRRLKAATEGLLLGAAIDGLVFSARVGRGAMRVRRGDASWNDVADEVKGLAREGQVPSRNDPTPENVDIVEDGEGFLVVNNKSILEGETLVDDDVGSAVVKTREGNYYRSSIHALAAAEAEEAGETVVNRDLFKTSAGRYVDRATAEEIAEGAGQRVRNEMTVEGGGLDASETAQGRQAIEEGEGPGPDIRDTSDLTDEQLEARAREIEGGGEQAAAEEGAQEGAEEAAERVVRDFPDMPAVRVRTRAQAESVAASMDWLAQNVKNGFRGGEFVDDQVDTFQAMREQLDGLSADDLAELTPDDVAMPNFSFYGDDTAARGVFALSQVALDALNKSNRAVTWKQRQARALRATYDAGGEEGVMNLLRAGATVADVQNTVKHMGRLYTAWLGKRAAHLGRLADEMPENPVYMEMLASTLDQARKAELFTQEMVSGIGRGLNEQKIELTTQRLRSFASTLYRSSKEGVESAVRKEGGHPFSGMSRRELLGVARNLRLQGENTEALLEALRYYRELPEGVRRELDETPQFERFLGLSGETWQKIIGVRAQAMLSGIGTQSVNLAATMAKTFVDPLTVTWAGVRSGNPGLAMQGVATEIGLLMNFHKAFAVGLRAAKEGVNILDPIRRMDEGVAQTAHLVTDEGPLKLIGSTAKVVGTSPGRGLMAGDEFLKQLNYRAHLTGAGFRQAYEEGIRNPVEIAARMRDAVYDGFKKDPTGSRAEAVNPMGINYAREQTFTNKVDDGIGGWLQEGANKLPVARLMFPFVRTPTNILRDVRDRTPIIWKWAQKNVDDLAAGGERAALARAKMETGSAMWFMGAMLASNGILNGKGPSDPALRQQWLEAGNVPNSIKIPGTEKAIPIDRMEPLSIPLLLMADFWTAVGEMQEDDAAAAAAAGAVAMGQTLTSRTYFLTLSDFFATITGPAAGIQKVEDFTARLGQSFIPNIAQSQNTDEFFREPRSFLEEVLSRTPGFSQDMEPRRGIFGEPVLRSPGYFNRAIMPMAPRDIENDPVINELVNLGKGFPPPSPEQGGLDWTDRSTYGKEWEGKDKPQSPYDHMMELKGTLELGGKTLREAMTDLVNSEQWQELTPGTQAARGGSRWEVANDLIQGYEDAARAVTLSKYSDVLVPHMTARQVSEGVSMLPQEQREQVIQGLPIDTQGAIEQLFGSLQAVTETR